MKLNFTKTNFLSWLQAIGKYDSHHSCPITVIYGDNDYLKYKTKILIKQKSNLSTSTLASKLESDDIRSLTESLSLFEEKNLYILEEKDYPNFLNLFSIILSAKDLANNFLIILDKTDKKIESLINSSSLDIYPIGCFNLWEKDILNYIDFSLKEYGINISHLSKIHIYNSLGLSLSLIDNEIKKLYMIYSKNNLSPINISDTDIKKSIFVLKKDYTFKLKDLLLQRQFSSILILIEDLLTRGESSLAILGLLCKHIRILYNIKILKEKNISNLSQELKLSSFVLNDYLKSEKYFSKELCIKILKQASKIDTLIKTSNLDDSLLLSNLIYTMIDHSYNT